MKYRKSQIAVIITFVIAVIFLFIAVFINLSKVSQVKTTTGTAADKAALGLASQLGSMSHYYKDKVLGGKTEQEGYTWLALVLVLVGSIAGGMFISPIVFLTGMGALVSMSMSTSMLEGISDRFNKEMTTYNALRENTMLGALLSTQSDDVELKRVGAGIFRDEATGEDYDLGAVPEMRNEKKVSRFLAWYYTKRIPLVSDNYLKDALDVFKSGLKRFIAIDEWDNLKWKINKFSYFIEPGPASKGADYEITCSSCSSWVKDVAHKQIAVMKIDATNPEGPDQIIGGFLKDKLISLLNRLEAAYNLTFCDPSGCKDVNILSEDLRMFLLRSKEVVDTPATAALNSITQWFPFFYDSAQHNLDKSSIDGDLEDDAYERLTRDQNFINTMITELETLNNTIVAPNILGDHGTYCVQGRGSVSHTCATALEKACPYHVESCGTAYAGSTCINYKDARWYGIYGTCTGSGSNHTAHPVCNNGDLYGAKPLSGWCSNLRSSPSCVSNNDGCAGDCDIPPTNTAIDNSYYFQGQLAHDNTSGPTEVEQAVKISRDLNYDIDNIKNSIANLADKLATYEPYTDENGNGVYDEEEPYTDLNDNGIRDSLISEVLRNKISYAWKNKPDKDDKQYSHFVQVAIEGYPEKLPYISENIEWIGLKKSWKLESGAGDFKITVWRYDQDQPTAIAKGAETEGWQLRRRKQTDKAEFDKTILEAMVNDIQKCGILNNPSILPPAPLPAGCFSSSYTDLDIDNLLNNFAITSTSEAHYGPEKSDIKIIKTEGD